MGIMKIYFGGRIIFIGLDILSVNLMKISVLNFSMSTIRNTCWHSRKEPEAIKVYFVFYILFLRVFF